MAFRLTSYLRESRDELKKVAWPSRTETRNHTLMVIGVSLFVAAFLGLIDLGLGYILQITLIR